MAECPVGLVIKEQAAAEATVGSWQNSLLCYPLAYTTVLCTYRNLLLIFVSLFSLTKDILGKYHFLLLVLIMVVSTF